MTDEPEFDVLVAGGGLVGASLARALAGSPLRIALVEAMPPGRAGKPGFDERSTALAPTSRRLFRALGCWNALAAEAAPIRVIHVSDQGHFGITRLRAADHGLDALGHVVPNRVLGGVLAEGLAGQRNVQLFAPARVRHVQQDAGGVIVDLDGDDLAPRVRTRLLVAADGGDSPIRRQLGITMSQRDYGQSALVANVAPDRDPGGWAYERFTRTGPLALLPLSGGRCALIWTMPPARAARLMQLDDAAVLGQLQDAFGYRLGRINGIGERSLYPLHLRQARRLVEGRTVLLGNAARTLHPVAGQGFNLALRDVAELADCICRAAHSGWDPGSAAVLAGYQRRRRRDQRKVAGFTDALVRAFSSSDPLLATGRNLGLVALELIPGLRHGLARQAMGWGGPLPRLSRGLLPD